MGVAAVGAGLSLYQTIDSAKKEKDARKALNNLQAPELNNTGDNLSPSTLGADILRNDQSRLAATEIDVLRGTGTRGIVGGIGQVNANTNRINEGIAANIDEQQKNIDLYKANDAQNIRGMKENRYNSDVEGLSSQYNSGQNGMYQGFGNIIRSTGALVGQGNGYNQTMPPNTIVNPPQIKYTDAYNNNGLT